MMFTNQYLNVNAEIAWPAENFNHPARRRFAAARKTRHLHVDDGAIQLRQAQSPSWRMRARLRLQLRRQLVTGRDNNFLQQPRFVRRDRVAAQAVPEQADDRAMCAVENAKDAPFRAPRAIRKAVAALDARQDVIAVHRAPQPL